MREVIGDLFSYDGVAIGHGVNCRGLMGAGIARQFCKRYPAMYDSYRVHCENSTLTPGGVFMYRGADGKLIVNLASQNYPGADASYDWLTTSILTAIDELLDAGIHELAIPQVGCGIGGLSWSAVRIILKLIEIICSANDEPFEFVVYSLPVSASQETQ